MESSEIRQRFLKFFEVRGHKIIPSAPLVPENDPSVLFNTAGMQPLVPYLLGQDHPMGNKIVDIQKCVRTGDLEDIGDNRHFSFFEMMGNWSLGDYFKQDAIKWSYEFLTSKEEGLGLDPKRLYVTVFEGNEDAPEDMESQEIWEDLGLTEYRIYSLGVEDNWWSPGDNGPCGPCTEMFYDMTDDGLGDLSKEEFLEKVKKEEIVEIWNDVFMEFEKKDGKVIGKLKQKNVDTGAGLERITAVMQNKKTAYDTDLFSPIMKAIKHVSGDTYHEHSARIVADHIRASAMLISEGVVPNNKDQGYVLRRLLRRAIIKMRTMLGDKFKDQNSISIFSEILEEIFEIYKDTGHIKDKEKVFTTIKNEENKFRESLELGLKEFEKGTDAFVLATTYGFPIELTLELAKEKNIKIDLADFYKKMTEHQKLSQTASAGMFKGGLANTNEKTVRLHTAHHLLLASLQQVLGKSVKQRGSNITEERLRLDFTFDRKMTDEEKKQVEDIVNEKIKAGLNVVRREMPLAEAEKLGAEMEFGAKYPEMVSVYFIEEPHPDPLLVKERGNSNAFSIEFCGGPHVENTNELGIFKIQKEEASSQGIRRIKATLE